jgi:hypothetical protein
MYIATTRFNHKTLEQNRNFLKRNNITDGTVYYGSPMEINPKYPAGIEIFVVEMNNDVNQITGISIVTNYRMYRNVGVTNLYVYNHGNFNRYIYKGKHLLTRDILLQKNPKLVEILETICFKGKSHLKRMWGITFIKDKLLKDPRCEKLDLLQELKHIFKEYNTTL